MFLEASASALRSATFALKKLLAEKQGFTEWYEAKQKEMRGDPVLRWIIELRNAAEKEGLILAEYGPRTIIRYYKNGSAKSEAAAPELRIEGLESGDVVAALAEAHRRISLVVEEAHKLFLPKPPGRQILISLETVRETDDGGWEHFTPSK